MLKAPCSQDLVKGQWWRLVFQFLRTHGIITSPFNLFLLLHESVL